MLFRVLDFYIGIVTFFFISTFWIFYETALWRFFTASAILLPLVSSACFYSSKAYDRSLIRLSISYWRMISCCLILKVSAIYKLSFSSAFSCFNLVTSASIFDLPSLASALSLSSQFISNWASSISDSLSLIYLKKEAFLSCITSSFAESRLFSDFTANNWELAESNSAFRAET